ncbi:MAG: class I SAM-dependent methyltransferase [candidate division Zixibacteria bacterium]|nr:class I SAM-dependent methyltransferase [candidate division Zixibacteria bacterium]MDH4033642.1 class I SAM-dependent methyltransferase [candidate division Zixibacteria bacterium]
MCEPGGWMNISFKDTLHSRESVPERGSGFRLFDFDRAAAEGNRLGNLIAATYKLFNGFDSFERHYLAASFIKYHACRTILDLGGLSGKLRHFLKASDSSIDVANISGKADITYDGKTLPVADNEYDCVVSLDVLEHVPPDQRSDFLKEVLRVTSRYLFLSTPYKSQLHLKLERRLFDLHRRAFHTDHPFLKEHLVNGLVDENDCCNLMVSLESTDVRFRSEFFFAGDTVALARPIEKLWTLRASSPSGFVCNYPLLTWDKVGLWDKLDCSPDPLAETNRLYLIIEKTGRVM